MSLGGGSSRLHSTNKTAATSQNYSSGSRRAQKANESAPWTQNSRRSSGNREHEFQLQNNTPLSSVNHSHNSVMSNRNSHTQNRSTTSASRIQNFLIDWKWTSPNEASSNSGPSSSRGKKKNRARKKVKNLVFFIEMSI